MANRPHPLRRTVIRRNQTNTTVLLLYTARFLRLGKSIMGEPKAVIARTDGLRYRELAMKLRGIARQSRLPGTRQKILDLASRCEGTADHLDTRSSSEDFIDDPY